MRNTACPKEERLLRIVTGDWSDWEAQDHADNCPKCRSRLIRLRIEVRLLRALYRTWARKPKLDEAQKPTGDGRTHKKG